MQQAGIYAITCVISGEQYVGSSKNVKARWSQHRGELRKDRNRCLVLQRAWNKYGEDAFTFSVLEYVDSIKDLIPREQYYLDTLQPAYNVRTIADRNTGIKWTPEQLANQNTGRIRTAYRHSPEAIEKIRAANAGRKFSEEHRRNLSVAKSHPSPEARANSSAARKGKVNRALVEASVNARRGKKRPPESVAKGVTTRQLRHAQGLYVESTQIRREQAKALAEANRGKHRSQATKDKIAAAHRVRDPKTGRFLKFTEGKMYDQ